MKQNLTLIRYSEAFKQQIILEFETGYLTASELRRKYGINGGSTIRNWIKKYGRFGLLPKVIRVEKPNERDQILALKAEIKRLKEVIADEVLDRKIAESTLEVICEDHGLNIEQVKKKVGAELPLKPSKKKRK
jgi:transposase-like protein